MRLEIFSYTTYKSSFAQSKMRHWIWSLRFGFDLRGLIFLEPLLFLFHCDPQRPWRVPNMLVERTLKKKKKKKGYQMDVLCPNIFSPFWRELFGGLREKTPGLHYLFSFLPTQPNTFQKSFFFLFSVKSILFTLFHLQTNTP